VEAQGFQPCETKSRRKRLQPPWMDNFADRTFFVTSVTWERRPVFRSERAAKLFVETLYGYRERGIFHLFEFVLMPDHFHLLVAPMHTVSLEKSMQFIKGGFSHRYMKETGSRTEIWERSFTNHRIRNERDYEQHRQYIRMNPVRAKFVESPEAYPYSSAYLGRVLDIPPQRLKPVA
jgi:putative transposase